MLQFGNGSAFFRVPGTWGYHLVQSFAAGEVTPELAHQVGLELAEKVLGGRFQVIVSTHLNTGHIRAPGTVLFVPL